MGLEEILSEIDFEREEDLYNQRICLGKDIAKKNSWNFLKFKDNISSLLNHTPDEDQWIHDYESWLLSISNDFFIDPISWALEYYQL